MLKVLGITTVYEDYIGLKKILEQFEESEFKFYLERSDTASLNVMKTFRPDAVILYARLNMVNCPDLINFIHKINIHPQIIVVLPNATEEQVPENQEYIIYLRDTEVSFQRIKNILNKLKCSMVPITPTAQGSIKEMAESWIQNHVDDAKKIQIIRMRFRTKVADQYGLLRNSFESNLGKTFLALFMGNQHSATVVIEDLSNQSMLYSLFVMEQVLKELYMGISDIAMCIKPILVSSPIEACNFCDAWQEIDYLERNSIFFPDSLAISKHQVEEKIKPFPYQDVESEIQNFLYILLNENKPEILQSITKVYQIVIETADWNGLQYIRNRFTEIIRIIGTIYQTKNVGMPEKNQFADLQQEQEQICAKLNSLIQHPPRDSKVPRKIIGALLFIEQNYSKPLSLNDIAQKVGISESYLSRSFKKFIGVGFTAYLQKVRIRQAVVLLNSGMQSISLVAKKTGFLDVRYFGRIFKKMLGETPTQYMGHLGRNSDQ